ncbi:hypothetical protein Lsed01_00861 [Demequina sediminis]|uniref:Class III signal peptide-containing protein n=1 Tax=Demequina sediminis TaxID=1930058 RepID=A0ABP9WFG7_9MICO|nr:hypothetical protein [Demequina sediminis]BDZ62485.1 hypothetical protein GCM10025873_22760 [Demequina sediminis]
MEATIYKALAFVIVAILAVSVVMHITSETDRVLDNAGTQFENTLNRAMSDILADQP